MDSKQVRHGASVVKPTARKPSPAHAQRSDLLAAAVAKHGLPAVEVLLGLVEAEVGDIRVKARLRVLIELEPAAFASALALIHGGRR